MENIIWRNVCIGEFVSSEKGCVKSIFIDFKWKKIVFWEIFNNIPYV